MSVLTFQDIISNLTSYWARVAGCSILQSYDIEVGAGTLSPHTTLRVVDSKPWNVCYVQYSRRPTDARFAKNPNRLGGYHQLQVILKPSPNNIQELCIQSLAKLGVDLSQHDIRFVEDDWENPSIGAAGLGFEVWCDGMEIIQFTYMQRMGGLDCEMISGEITYGLERVAMYVQDVNNVYDIIYNISGNETIIHYSDIFLKNYEIEHSTYYQEYHLDDDLIRSYFQSYQKQSQDLIKDKLILPAYEYCLKASHMLNIMDSRRLLSHNERTASIMAVRELARACCLLWKEKNRS